MKRYIATRITVDPAQCGGSPCVRGMRIRVTDVLDLLADGVTADQALKELPDLEAEDIVACLKFASDTLETVFPEDSPATEEPDDYDSLSPEVIADIEESLEDIEAGHLISLDNVREELGL